MLVRAGALLVLSDEHFSPYARVPETLAGHRSVHTSTLFKYVNKPCCCDCIRIVVFVVWFTGLKKEDVLNQGYNGHSGNGEEGDDEEEDIKQEEEDEAVSSTSPARPGVKVHLTPFELEGLWQLVHKLEELPAHKKCVPAGIRNAPALLSDIRVHA